MGLIREEISDLSLPIKMLNTLKLAKDNEECTLLMIQTRLKYVVGLSITKF